MRDVKSELEGSVDLEGEDPMLIQREDARIALGIPPSSRYCSVGWGGGQDVLMIRKEYDIPNAYEIRVPSTEERPNAHPEGVFVLL